MKKMILIFSFFVFSCNQNYNDFKKSTLISDISIFNAVIRKSGDGFRSDNGFLVPILFSYSPYSEKRQCIIESIDFQFKGLPPIRKISGRYLRKILNRSNVVSDLSSINFFLPIPYMSGPIEIVLHITEYEFEEKNIKKKESKKSVGCKDASPFQLKKVKLKNEKIIISTTTQELLLFVKVLPNMSIHKIDETKSNDYLNALNKKIKNEWSQASEQDLKKKTEAFKYEFFR